MGFDKNFVWGAATAAYQVEGAAKEDGKGESIWDVFSKEPGKTFEGHHGDVACDQYHRYEEDIQIMKKLGIQAYRFSVSWPRIFPEGTGEVNPKGLEYYDRLVDALLENGITPYMTLYHWDLPYALQLQGGWMNPSSPKWFYEYAKVIGTHFSDRVKHFFTINEPQCVIDLGYGVGIHAPGLKVGHREYFRLWHNVLKAHGRAVQALRETAKQKVEIGIAPCGGIYYPESEKPEDIEAARKANFMTASDNVQELSWNIGFCCDPIYFGQYPEDVLQKFGKWFPKFTDQDMELISQPTDFHGQNIYNGVKVRADEQGNPVRVARPAGYGKTAVNWPVTPECLYWGPKFLYERYKKPFYITENGMACHDVVSLDGKVHDPNRIDFVHRYLREYRRAAENGVDARGYFQWSLLDNYEWNSGYAERFGIVYVDYETQERIIKDSGYDYAEIIRTGGKNL
ncbi:MAG: GH1 family beta-glucosidase [Eubacteriales bacterium]|nr:GH1 family beta-glucosidase [Eubacteriales bacterium]